ncbi:hypothetical protein V7S43_003470 [Phytophthora oleae]|uniref:Tudor domain-containing protein n=1 Tax=Phytophthora oleae TaxID=2107226 RepID=A0ABD3FXA7_9STRA
MGTVTYDSHWSRPHDAQNVRELERMATHEFDPPLSNQELLGALRACNFRTQDAYMYLQASRRHKQRAVTIPASAPAAITSIYTMQRTPERVREKRRFSVSSASEADTPSKRHKDQSSLLVDMTEEKDEEEETEKDTPDTQQDTEMNEVAEVVEPPAGRARAQQLLLETVEDRVAARQALRNPEWVNGVWASLEVPAVLELAMQLNLTVDSLATWVKDLAANKAQEIQTRVASLIVEVAQKLPPVASGAEDVVACVPNDENLSKIDEEMAAITEAEDQSAEMKAFDRAKIAKRSIERLSSACKSYMDRLGWFAQSFDTKAKEKADVEESLKALGQKLDDLVVTCTGDVNEAQRSLADAMQMQETRTLQIIQLVDMRERELVEAGQTVASARLMSVVDVWSKEDVETKALLKSRSDSENRVERSALSVKVAEHALAFHKNLCILFRKVRERREASLTSFSDGLDEARAASATRATAALEKMIPMLTQALCQYYTFYSVQQLKAKEELQEQEKALEAHNEYFGDSAPIKKGDIERRIREFIGVTQSSMHVIMEIAEGQQQLWELKQSILPVSVRQVLIREFKALWLQLGGPMRDVMKKFVTTIEEASGGVVAVSPQQAPQPQPEQAVTMFVTANTLDEQVIPAFTVPAFTHIHVEAVTPYRTAISAVVAPNDGASSPRLPIAGQEPASAPSVITGSSETQLAICNETKVAPRPRAIECDEFAVGSILYSKFPVGENCAQFVRGQVLNRVNDDKYMVQYDNGDKFSVPSRFLFTREMMEQYQKAGVGEDMEMEDAEDKGRQGNCAIM